MKKSRILPVRLSEQHWELLREAALLTGRSLSGYLRHAAVTAAARESKPHPALTAVRRQLRQNPLDLTPGEG